MTNSKEKTGDQLVASIRKTKSEGDQPAAQAAPAKKKTAARRGAGTASRRPGGYQATDRAVAGPQDDFQSEGRVWPD